VITARGIGLTLFAVWVVWLVAAQSLAVSALSAVPLVSVGGGMGIGAWVPDLGLVLAVALVARGHPRDVPALAMLWGFARAAFAIDPPFAIFAGAAGVLVLARAMRSVVETHGALPRAFIAGACVLVFDAWLIAVHHVRHESLWVSVGSSPLTGLVETLLAAWPAAASTALCALVVGPMLARLPGLTPLRRGRW